MSAGVRVRRLGPWRLVPVMVLAGLLHVLGCAHGPQAAGVPRSDTPSAVAVPGAVHAHPAVPSADVPCRHGGGASCTGADEPAVAGARADLPAPAAAEDPVLPGCGTGRNGAGVRECRAVGPGGTGADRGSGRAALGIWRA
ncbi:hypothetical protein ACIA8H_27250 [Streptomyces goshikiensis]|uniref:hypothetical protein n=1 Tax=Streptomyces goshikiensis TaxID=1942 RepID=UPI0037AF1BDF